MKELTVMDIEGNIISQALINVDGDDFIQTYDIPLNIWLKGFSLIDDEETRKAKELARDK